MKQQMKSLEDVQCHALHIIAGNISYSEACHSFSIQVLENRGIEQCKMLFTQIASDKCHILH